MIYYKTMQLCPLHTPPFTMNHTLSFALSIGETEGNVIALGLIHTLKISREPFLATHITVSNH